MNELKVHNDPRGHPDDVHIDGVTHPLDAYLFLGAIPADPPASILLTYGNSDVIGRLIMTLYERSIVEHPEQAWVLEQVARGIIGLADAARRGWPGEGTGPEVVQ